MRIQIRRLDLIGGRRSVEFAPGLNIVTGPISTGKTTLLELCQAVLRTRLNVRSLVPEVRQHVSAIAAELLIGDQNYEVVRRLSSSPTAPVDVAGAHQGWRLPVSQPDTLSSQTYGNWLLEHLNLPTLRVPSAPTRIDSDPTPVTINDYFMYCRLNQDEIDNNVFGHDNPFQNIKRKYVFEILYGLYSIESAKLQDELRSVLSELQQLKAQSSLFIRFLDRTPLANRALILKDLNDAGEALRDLDRGEDLLVPGDSLFTRLRDQFLELEATQHSLNTELVRERSVIGQLVALISELEAQSDRLTRTIVADALLLDFDFRVCPRCGTEVDMGRSDPDVCGLCLQVPAPREVNRESLVSEQDRIGLQLEETRELIETRGKLVQRLEDQLVEIESRKLALSEELSAATRAFVSEEASSIADQAARRSRLTERISHLEAYMSVFSRLDEVGIEVEALETRRVALEGALEAERSKIRSVNERISHLEGELGQIIDRFRLPILEGEAHPRIDRKTYLPVIFGRSFDELSSQGLKVLVNVAHALAHHQTSIALDLHLPQILFIDGLTSNMGHEGEDRERVEAVYRYLIELSARLGDDLQIIVADNDVPQLAEEFVRLRLASADQLISID